MPDIDIIPPNPIEITLSTQQTIEISTDPPNPVAITVLGNQGAITEAIATHVQAIDPHPQYATDSALTESIATRATPADIVTALTSHTNEADPHPQYINGIEATAAVDAGIAAHVATTDPHPFYVDNSELASAISTRQPANSNLSTLAAITPGATGQAVLASATPAAARSAIGVGTRVLWSDNTAASITGSTAETAFTGKSFTLPANTLPPGSAIWIWALFSQTNQANSKSLAFKLGGTNLFTPAMPTTNPVTEVQRLFRVRSTNQLIGSSAVNGSSAALLTVSADLTTDLTFSVHGTLSNAADTLTLEGITILTLL